MSINHGAMYFNRMSSVTDIKIVTDYACYSRHLNILNILNILYYHYLKTHSSIN